MGHVENESLSLYALSSGRYELGTDVLGWGESSKVLLAHDAVNGVRVAVKFISKACLTPHSLKSVRREVAILSRIHHENIIDLLAHFEDDTAIYMIFPIAQSDVLEFLMKRTSRLDEHTARRIFLSMTAAVEYCHAHNIAHRDVKLENFLILEDGRIVLADFGYATMVHPDRLLVHACGSVAYSAPEVVAERPYDALAADIWSLGVVLYCLIHSAFPFYDEEPAVVKARIATAPIAFASDSSLEARQLMKNMLSRSPRKRAKWSDIKSSAWFSVSRRCNAEVMMPAAAMEIDIAVSV
jgi:serine/threonine protein kinase